MTRFEQAMIDLIDTDDDTKIELAAESYAKLIPFFRNFDKEHNGLVAILAALLVPAMADGELSQKEFTLIQALLKASGERVSHEDIIYFAQQTLKDYATPADVLMMIREHLNDEGASILIQLVAAVCSIDDKLYKNELALLEALR